MEDRDIIDECIKVLAQIHDLTYDETKKLYVEGQVKKWDLDPMSLGGFAIWLPYQVSKA